MKVDRSATTTVLRTTALALALAYLAIGLAAMLAAPRVPYADQWLFYPRLIEQPISSYAFAAENGHREVLPKFVRWIELRQADADQSVQIGLALVLAVLTLVVLVRAIWTAPIDRAPRVGAVLIATLGLFWLGNERVLTHSAEAIHAYLITCSLACGLVLVARASARETLRASLAMLCAWAATFSFGSGIAVFPALLVVLALRHAPPRAWWPIVAGLALAIALYVTSEHGATTSTLRFDPVAQVGLLLHWLSAPLVYVFWPLLDTDIAQRLPAGVARDVGVAIAGAWTSAFGDIDRSSTPQSIVGGFGIAVFAGLAWHTWRRRATTPAAVRIALGIAAFGLAVGAVVALSRSAYFEQHADQIQAPRYLVWSSLFWAGTGMALVLRMASARHAIACAVILALVLAPSQAWMGRLAASMRSAAEQVALGGVVGVLDRHEPLGESVFDEMRAALPLLEREGVAMYAWPELAWLGHAVPGDRIRAAAVREWTVEPVDNRFEGSGVRITSISDEATPRLLVLDRDGIAIGLLMRDPAHGPNVWRGWARGAPDHAEVTFVTRAD